MPSYKVTDLGGGPMTPLDTQNVIHRIHEDVLRTTVCGVVSASAPQDRWTPDELRGKNLCPACWNGTRLAPRRMEHLVLELVATGHLKPRRKRKQES